MLTNENTLNIFCDASITKLPNGKYLGCPGSIAVTTDTSEPSKKFNILDSDQMFLEDTTNQHSEIIAVLLGVRIAIKHKNEFADINIFSDSGFSIFGLRDWVFGWVNNVHDHKLYSSSGKPVSHQAIFMKIIDTIVKNKLTIRLLHQKGHVRVYNESSLKEAHDMFIRSNGISLNFEDLVMICDFNNIIDSSTRIELKKCDSFIKYNVPFYCVPSAETIQQYRSNVINTK